MFLYLLQQAVYWYVFCVSDLPYSQKSRDLFPLWEELAEAFKERQEVVVARMDASANDINMSMQGGYPSLCLFPALYSERVMSHPTSFILSISLYMLVFIVCNFYNKNHVYCVFVRWWFTQEIRD